MISTLMLGFVVFMMCVGVIAIGLPWIGHQQDASGDSGKPDTPED